MVKLKLPNKNSTLRYAVDYYLHSDVFAKLSGKTQYEYESQLAKALATVVEGKPFGDYSLKHIRSRHTNTAYQEWLKTGIHNANHKKLALSAAWKYCMRLDVIQTDPVGLIKTKTPKPRKVKWTREQVKQFLDTAYSDFKWRSIGLIVHMAYDLAQRVGDMRVLTWDKIDLDVKRIDITQSKRGADVHLPLSDALCSMLRQQKVDFGFQQYVAPKTTPVAGAYVPYPITQIDDAINEVKQAAGLPKNLTAMDLRRTAITEMIEAGVDLAGVMQVSGHSSPESVKPYMVNTFSGASRALAKRRGDVDAED